MPLGSRVGGRQASPEKILKAYPKGRLYLKIESCYVGQADRGLGVLLLQPPLSDILPTTVLRHHTKLAQ